MDNIKQACSLKRLRVHEGEEMLEVDIDQNIIIQLAGILNTHGIPCSNKELICFVESLFEKDMDVDKISLTYPQYTVLVNKKTASKMALSIFNSIPK